MLPLDGSKSVLKQRIGECDMISFLLGFSICLNIALILVSFVYIQLKKNLDLFGGMSDEPRLF